jgi:hypothetical protein
MQDLAAALGRPRWPKGAEVRWSGYKVTFVDNQGLAFVGAVTLRLHLVTFGYIWLQILAPGVFLGE